MVNEILGSCEIYFEALEVECWGLFQIVELECNVCVKCQILYCSNNFNHSHKYNTIPFVIDQDSLVHAYI